MVGGGKITTKIINYPDNNEYLKLCGLKWLLIFYLIEKDYSVLIF